MGIPIIVISGYCARCGRVYPTDLTEDEIQYSSNRESLAKYCIRCGGEVSYFCPNNECRRAIAGRRDEVFLDNSDKPRLRRVAEHFLPSYCCRYCAYKFPWRRALRNRRILTAIPHAYIAVEQRLGKSLTWIVTFITSLGSVGGILAGLNVLGIL